MEKQASPRKAVVTPCQLHEVNVSCIKFTGSEHATFGYFTYFMNYFNHSAIAIRLNNTFISFRPSERFSSESTSNTGTASYELTPKMKQRDKFYFPGYFSISSDPEREDMLNFIKNLELVIKKSLNLSNIKFAERIEEKIAEKYNICFGLKTNEKTRIFRIQENDQESIKAIPFAQYKNLVGEGDIVVILDKLIIRKEYVNIKFTLSSALHRPRHAPIENPFVDSSIAYTYEEDDAEEDQTIININDQPAIE